MASDVQSDMMEGKRISGSPSMDQLVVTSASGTLTYSGVKKPGGFQVVAQAVVTWTSVAGTVNTSITVPAGMTVPGFMSQIAVASGTIILHFW